MSRILRKEDLCVSEISQWLEDNFSLKGELSPLPGESDRNYKVTTLSGENYVCKLCSSSCDLDLLSAQNDAMVLLEEKELAAIPQVLISNGGKRLVPFRPSSTADENAAPWVGRVLTFVSGNIMADGSPYSNQLVRNLGNTVGLLNKALVGFDHPAFHYKFDWDLAHAMEVVERYRDLISDSEVRNAVDVIYQNFEKRVVPHVEGLKKSVIHDDVNDYNVLTEGDEVSGLIDFGDMVYTYTICDLAIAMAYAVLEAEDVLSVIKEMTLGYHTAMPVDENELEVLFSMMSMRLAVSACMAAHQMRLRPDDPYLVISQEPIRKTLPKLLALDVDDVQDALKQLLA